MLILARKMGEAIFLPTVETEIVIHDIYIDKYGEVVVRVGIDAPASIPILRDNAKSAERKHLGKMSRFDERNKG